jgi:hypothetical protein
MSKDEHGYIVVETTISFMLFVLLNLSILSLINIVTVQARIHYAMTQAAETISMYTYTLDAMGVADHLVTSAQKAEKAESEINTFKSNVNSVISALESLDISGLYTAGQTTYSQVSSFAGSVQDDPEGMLQLFLNYGVQEGLDILFEQAVRPLVGRYLTNGEMSGDEYLTAAHVVGGLSGLDFNDFDLLDLKTTSSNDSRFLTGDGDVKLVVKYKIDYTFGALPLPFTELEITQEVITKAWLSGYGEGYTGNE